MLLNNAGIGIKGISWEGLDNWHKIFDVNLFGYVSSFCSLCSFRLSLPLQNCKCATNFRSCQSIHNSPRYSLWRSFADLCSFIPTSVPSDQNQSMLHQENPAMVITTGSKQGITNPPYVTKPFFSPPFKGIMLTLTIE